MSTAKQPETLEGGKKRVIYLGIEDALESSVAIAWIKSKGLDPKRHLTFHVPLNRITPDMVFIPIVRGPQRTPLRYEDFDRDLNQKVTRNRKPDELVGEVHECTPVSVTWVGNGRAVETDAFSQVIGGTLDRDAFFDALARGLIDHEVYPRVHNGEPDRLVLSWT